MNYFLDFPILFFALSILAFWLAARLGAFFREKVQKRDEEENDDFTLILGATLTLLGLIIGFTFSMALTRYDQRKNYEEQEANAIGTEYVRVDMLPAADAAKERGLLKSYLDQRILYYQARDGEDLHQLNGEIARLQSEMWAVVVQPASESPTPVAAIVLSGMNDVLNSQGYTQAAWWNRIPIAAWILLIVLSVFCNLLVGYVAHGKSAFLFLILPIALAISLFLIADIDSPRRGMIRVQPQNLISLAESLRAQ